MDFNVNKKCQIKNTLLVKSQFIKQKGKKSILKMSKISSEHQKKDFFKTVRGHRKRGLGAERLRDPQRMLEIKIQ